MLRRPMMALAAAMILFAAACSDGGPSASAYFEGLDAALQQADDRTAASVDAALPDPAADVTLEQNKDLLRTTLEERAAIHDELLATLADLHPPANANRLHGLFINAIKGLDEQIVPYRDRLLAADSVEAFDAAARGTELLDDAMSALADLCLDMEDAASEHGISLDLSCSNP